MDVAIVILVFIVVMFIAALVFGGWLIVSIARLIGRGLAHLTGSGSSRQPPSAPHTVRCEQPKCLAVNPDQARFCRRCGKVIDLADFARSRRSIGPQRIAG